MERLLLLAQTVQKVSLKSPLLFSCPGFSWPLGWAGVGVSDVPSRPMVVVSGTASGGVGGAGGAGAGLRRGSVAMSCESLIEET